MPRVIVNKFAKHYRPNDTHTLVGGGGGAGGNDSEQVFLCEFQCVVILSGMQIYSE